MKSTYTRVLLWTIGTAIACIALMIATSWLMSLTIRRDDPFSRSLSLQLDTLRRAYTQGGREELQRQMQRIEEYFPGQRYLLDSAGQDLVTGENRTALASRGHRPGPFPRFTGKDDPIIYTSEDKAFTYMIMPRWRPSFWAAVAPQLFWIVVAAAFLSWVFTRSLVAPLRELRGTVDRFGRGDLTARILSNRHDEFGDVSRAFDQMADRIETLLTAERRLLQDVSHELRTPLSRLGFAIELARTAPDRPAALDRIRKETERLGSLVAQLLQVTRAEGDPAARDMNMVSLDALVTEVAEDSAWEAELRHVRIVSRIEAHSRIRGDKELLRRAVENIVRNAIRHAPDGTAVEMSLSESAATARIAVRDEGSGVAEENLEQIFKPFFREDTSRSAATGGIGLGLAIAFRAIHLHHGSLRASNALPGLLVEIDLPVSA